MATSQSKQLIPISFAGGLDTKTDPKQVLPGKLLALQNGIFLNAGAINKRWGYTALGTRILGGGNIAAASAIEPFNDELILFDGSTAYSYLTAENAWMPKGHVVSVIQTNRNIVRNAYSQTTADTCTLNGVTVTVYQDVSRGLGDQSRFSIADATSHTTIFPDVPFAGVAPYWPKVIAFGNYIYVFATTLSEIVYYRIDPTNPLTNPVGPTNLFATNGFFDVCVCNGVLFVAAYSSGNVLLKSYDASITLQHSATVANPGSNGIFCINVTPTPDGTGNVWVTYGDAGLAGVSCSSALYGPTLSVILAPVQVIVAAQPLQSLAAITVTGTTLTVFATSSYTVAFNYLIQTNTLTSAGTLGHAAGSAPVFLRGVSLASKPFIYNGTIYTNVNYQSDLQSTYFTVDVNGNIVAKVNPGVAGFAPNQLPECQAIAAGIFSYGNLVRELPSTVGGVTLNRYGVNVTTLDFTDEDHFLSAVINKGLYTVGGVMQSYDGVQFAEHGFHIYPEGVQVSGGTGGVLGTGTFFYAVTYEYVDNNGLIQYSVPSVAVSVTFGSGSTNSATLTIPTLRLTSKANVRIGIYRTTANGVILYSVFFGSATIYNNPAVDSITVTDNAVSDTTLQSQAAMYTQPLAIGNPILPDDAPPSCNLIAVYADRIIVVGKDDPYAITYSQKAIPTSPMQFSSRLRLSLDPDGGPITAIQRLDDKLIIYKSNAIFYLIGQGPTATGDQNDFEDPVAIPSGQVGCIGQQTLVTTPMGHLFASSNGIFLLDRGLNVVYKGAPVEAFNALTITSATLIPNQWVVFTTATGVALVYDYLFDQWSTFLNHNAVDSCLFLGQGNRFVFATPNGQVFEQTPGVFTDAGAAIPLTLTTAWINPGVIQGYMRVYHAFILGAYKGTHNLEVQAAFDYDSAPRTLMNIPSDKALGLGPFAPGLPLGVGPFGAGTPPGGALSGAATYQFRVDLLRKCQSLQLTLSETDAGNEGCSLSALTLLVGVKTGGNKLSSRKQFGGA